jgi:hypothetical protein
LDRLTITVDPKRYIRWPNRGGFQPAEIAVNARPLIELVTPFEEAHVAAENAQSGGELRAGDYHYPAVTWIEELRRPSKEAFVLGCTCGIVECWAIVVDITRDERTVRWSNLRHNHRVKWRYDLGPFVFDRVLYEAEIVRAMK